MISAHDALLLFAIGLVYVFTAVALAALHQPGQRHPSLDLQAGATPKGNSEDIACAI